MEDTEVKPILVIDIPPDTTAEQAEEMLRRPYDNYYLVSVIGWGKFGARAIYRRRGRWYGEAGTNAVLSLKTGGNKANRDGKDEAAKAIIRDNPDMTIPALISRLTDAGIERGKTWVSGARTVARGRSCSASHGDE